MLSILSVFTWNEDAWKQRQGMPHPQAAFMDGDLTGKTSDAAKIAKAKGKRSVTFAKCS